MNVKIEDISSVKKKLSIEIAAEKVDAELAKALQKVAKSAKVKGFRPGKVPRTLLEQYYGAQIEQQALERLINDSYFGALIEHRVPAISDPEITENTALEKGKNFSYEAQVEVKPEIEAKDYTGLALEKEKFEFDEKIVADRLEELRQSRAELKVSEGEAAREGDFVIIDFEGSVDGELFAGGAAQGHVLELGSGSFIPGFEEQLVGMKRGDERTVEVTFPENYGNKELAGKLASFRVNLHEIKEKAKPELNDEFARELGLENLEQLREKIADNYKSQEIGRITGDLRERLVKVLIARNPVEVPEKMVQGQLDHMLSTIRRRLQSQGMSLEMMGMTDESFRPMYRDTAVSQVQGMLLLEAIARQEEIGVEGAELDDKIREIAEMSNAPLDAVKDYYSKDEARQGLLSQAREEKAVQFLLEKSTITEVEKEQLSTETKEEQ
ncbi:MAG: trigger factor [Desulfuromonadales bacterium]